MRSVLTPEAAIATASAGRSKFACTLPRPGASRAHAVTCSQLGKNCGSLSDGCSTTLNCGIRSGAQTCGAGGVADEGTVDAGFRCRPLGAVGSQCLTFVDCQRFLTCENGICTEAGR